MSFLNNFRKYQMGVMFMRGEILSSMEIKILSEHLWGLILTSSTLRTGSSTPLDPTADARKCDAILKCPLS